MVRWSKSNRCLPPPRSWIRQISDVATCASRWSNRFVRSRNDPRSGERSYLRQQVEHSIRSKRYDPRSGERSYLRQQVEQSIRSKRYDPRSGERSYQWRTR